MSLTFVILTHNSQQEIKGCLDTIKNESILVLDDHSTDQTLSLVKSYKNVKILTRVLDNFSSQRNFAIKKVKTDWVFFLDADERLTQKSLKEILKVTSLNSNYSAFKLRRLNYFFGRPLKTGGYWPDWQTRLFKINDFIKYSGVIHETPEFKGQLGSLEHYFIHHSHKNLIQGLNKSITWTKKEAQEFIKVGHSKITWWRILKVMITEFTYRYFIKKAFLSGFIGFTESLTQAINRYFVYQQIWEMQQQPTIKELYHRLDKDLK